MNRGRSSSVKRRKPGPSSSQDNSTIEGKPSDFNQKKKARTTETTENRPAICHTIIAHFEKMADTHDPSSATVADHALDSCIADSEGDMCESQGEPSNTDITKVLQNTNISLNTELDLLNDTVESLKGDVFDLQQENAWLKAQLDQCQKRQEDIKAQVHRSTASMRSLQRSCLKGTSSILGGTTSNCFSSKSHPTRLSWQRRARRKH